MMIFVNAFTTEATRPVSALRTLLLLLNPFAPHLTSELWETLGNKFPVAPVEITSQPLARLRSGFLVEDEVEIALQVNGKVRARITVADRRDEGRAGGDRAGQRAGPRIHAGQTIRKVVVVREKLVNVVAS